MLIVTLPHGNLVKSTETRQGRLFSTVSHLLARPMLSGFGGGINRHTEGISMSRPPGPVTSHLLRCELSFRMPSFPFKIPFCRRQQNVQWEETLNYSTHVFHNWNTYIWANVWLCVWEHIYPTWSCLKSHKAWTMMGLLLFSSGLRGFSLTMVLDLFTRLWTCLLFSTMRSFSFCKYAKTCVYVSACNYHLTLKLSTNHRHFILSLKSCPSHFTRPSVQIVHVIHVTQQGGHIFVPVCGLYVFQEGKKSTGPVFMKIDGSWKHESRKNSIK